MIELCKFMHCVLTKYGVSVSTILYKLDHQYVVMDKLLVLI